MMHYVASKLKRLTSFLSIVNPTLKRKNKPIPFDEYFVDVVPVRLLLQLEDASQQDSSFLFGDVDHFSN
jgi:hypothetical protein